MAHPLQFAYRTSKAIGITQADPAYEPLAGFTRPEGNLRCCVYSSCGQYFAYASPEEVVVVDTSTGAILTTLSLTMVFELRFSPRGIFLYTWERPSKDEAGDATKNLKVWRTREEVEEGNDKQPLGRFVQKSQSGWNLQYTADEKYCARLVSNEVQFFESHDLTTVWNKLKVDDVSNFSIAPGQNNHIAVFVPERKGQPASVKIFAGPHFTSLVGQKSFFKGDKVQLKWNSQGTGLLVLAQTDVDRSNKSYYGETTLYLLSANGGTDTRITLDKDGPIHDMTWSPTSKEFGVVYGYMPAKTTIFNSRGVAIHSFPIGPRNTIIFSPTGRFALVAGFGNLAGQMDVYDLEKDYRKLCTIESGNPSVCTWSPDSRFIMTATTSPRLRVDNGVKLWHVSGGLIYNEDMVELYHVVWRPMEPSCFGQMDAVTSLPTPHASAVAYLGAAKTPSKPVGAYRPPGARGASTPLHFRREDEGGAAHTVGNGSGPFAHSQSNFGRYRGSVAGLEPDGARSVPGTTPAAGADEQLSKAALKNKKKRSSKKGRDGEAIPGAPTEPAGAETGASAGGSPSGATGFRPPNGPHFNRRNSHQPRSRSRHPTPSRTRSVAQGHRDGSRHSTSQNRDGHGRANGHQGANANGAGGAVNDQGDGGSNQSPVVKKIRGLQKKVRAIEDLEMRLAGGEKLEDTQLKKIRTKASVMQELERLKELA